MQHMATYELGKIIHGERLEEARRERLARSVGPKHRRSFVWTERKLVPHFRPARQTTTYCVP